MGYTHYWTINKKGNRENYIKAIKAMNTIARANKEILSGYSAYTTVKEYGGIKLNGKGYNAHEDFIFREHIALNESFNFCKTANKPYDTVVVACLVVAKHYMGEDIQVTSDGYKEDWHLGTLLANSILKRKTLKNPIKLTRKEYLKEREKKHA
jgi:hypothetical protein